MLQSPSSFFRLSRGLRQGCPLSPFLFLLIAEALSRLLNRAREENLIKGVNVTNQTELTHVLFVDDVLMSGEGTLNNLQNLEKILRRYQKATSMKINLEKSNLIHNNLDEDFITQAKSLIPVSISQIDEGFKYLGFHLKPNSYSTQDWMWLYKKIESRILLWTNHFLSRGGRLVLLKAVLQSIPVYWASIAHIPKGIIAKIRKKCINFLWTTRSKKEGIPLVKWPKIVLPKSRGGWGIKNLDLFCKALAAKSLWRLVENPDMLWGRTLREKYFPNASIKA